MKYNKSIQRCTRRAVLGAVYDAISTSVNVGYRCKDCAQYYCNGKEIGDALKKLFGNGVHLSGYSQLGKRVENNILKKQVLHTTAKKLGKTPAQTALRWGLQMGHNVLPKSTNIARIK
ncbi:NADPH-dependent aldo-keto reductase, chloroplastic [Trifolium repens]|nr:NADPH-dependent aldo-keto reductase, chloroplastic [Trifolium repens]